MFDEAVIAPTVAGFALGGSLIVAIGAQNAFILRQGLVRSHVFLVCLIAAVSDALLIAAGVAGLGAFISGSQFLVGAVTLAGAGFLSGYAVLAFRRAMAPGSLNASERRIGTAWAAASTCFALTFLNPHVYLDTVLLIGGLSGQYVGPGRLAFGAGAITASFVWFFALGYGARLLAPVFARPAAWRILDLFIAAIMSILALGLLWRLVGS